MLIEPTYFSFKDPDASVLKNEKGYTRYIFFRYKEQYDHLMISGLYEELVNANLLIPHHEIQPDTKDPKVYKQLLPEQISFQSYPFEWSFLQWSKATLAFLKINQIALKYGMILKDATPYNFYLKGGKAILFDTSSFIFFKDNDSWLAYRQFCEVFFAPFALMKYNGAGWAKLYMSSLRGLPMKFVSRQLPNKSWLNLSCFLHIHLHAKFEGKKSKKSSANKGFTIKQLQQLLELFTSTVKSWKKAFPFPDKWINYYEFDIESHEYLEDKQRIVTEWLKEANPKSVIDLGANTGKFSMIAANIVENVLAIELDDACVDKIETEIQNKKLQNITTLVSDLSETSPGLGMLNQEFKSLLERGKSEMVIGLALVHHLCIGKNLSLQHIAELFSNFTSKFAIIEFIPKEDEKVKFLLSSRDDIFSNYNQNELLKQFSHFFELTNEIKIKNSNRVLLLWKKRVITN